MFVDAVALMMTSERANERVTIVDGTTADAHRIYTRPCIRVSFSTQFSGAKAEIQCRKCMRHVHVRVSIRQLFHKVCTELHYYSYVCVSAVCGTR